MKAKTVAGWGPGYALPLDVERGEYVCPFCKRRLSKRYGSAGGGFAAANARRHINNCHTVERVRQNCAAAAGPKSAPEVQPCGQ